MAKEIKMEDINLLKSKIIKYFDVLFQNIDRNLFDTMKKSAEKNDLFSQFEDVLLTGVLNSATFESNNVFLELFKKGKNLHLRYLLNVVSLAYDQLDDNTVSMEEGIKEAIAIQTGNLDDLKNIDRCLENIESTVNSVINNVCHFVVSKNQSTEIENEATTKTISNVYTVYDEIYDNIITKLSLKFFYTVLMNPFFVKEKFINDLQDELTNDDILRVYTISRSHDHITALIIKNFYSIGLDKRNIFKASSTYLNNLLNNEKIRNYNTIAKLYKEEISQFLNLYEWYIQVRKENKFKSYNDFRENEIKIILTKFYINRLFKYDFIKSISHEHVQTLIKDTNLDEFVNFIKERKEEEIESFFVPMKYVNTAYNVHLLELLALFNVDLGCVNFGSIISVSETISYTDKNLLTVYNTIVPTNNFDLIENQKRKIDLSYNFIFDFLAQYRENMSYLINTEIEDILQYLSLAKENNCLEEIYDYFLNKIFDYLDIDEEKNIEINFDVFDSLDDKSQNMIVYLIKTGIFGM